MALATMTKVNAASLVIWTAVILGSVNGVRLWTRTTSTISSSTQRGAVVPYTVVSEERLSDGKAARPGGRYTVAVARDGSYVIWAESLGDVHPTRIASQRMIRLADGTRIDTDEIRKLKSTMRDEFRRLSLRDTSRTCLLGEETLLGRAEFGRYDAVQIRKGSKLMWLAPTLGCAELKMRRVWGAAFAEREATAVIPGEPEPVLFNTDGLTEALPSAVFRRPNGDPTGAAYDAKYLRNRIQASQ